MNENKTFYTLLVYSENIAGILNQITAVFTRRQVNIESLNVSASSIPGVHKYTITAWSDVIKASFYTDEQLFIREVGLYKLSTPIVLDNPEISKIIRGAGANIMEVNPTYVAVMLGGMTEDITGLYRALNKYECVLQYTRSGRVALTRSTVEQVTDFLEKQEKKALGNL